MTPKDYTEDTLVQQTTAEYLEQQLGWRSVYAYNNETYVSNPHPQPLSQGKKGVVAETRDHSGICLGRGSDHEVVLTEILRQKLADLNKGLPDTAYDDAVRQITGVVASQSMMATNREKYDLIRNGIQVTFRNDKGERVRQRLRLIDFEHPEENDFLCVRELWVRGDLYRRRAVAGVPMKARTFEQWELWKTFN